METKTERYRNPPKSAYRKLGLGQLCNGRIKVIAGFSFRWWEPGSGLVPLVVYARVIRSKIQSADQLPDEATQ